MLGGNEAIERKYSLNIRPTRRRRHSSTNQSRPINSVVVMTRRIAWNGTVYVRGRFLAYLIAAVGQSSEPPFLFGVPIRNELVAYRRNLYHSAFIM